MGGIHRPGLRCIAVIPLYCRRLVSAADEPDKSTLDQIKAALDELKTLKSSQPQTVNTNTLAIESWLLTSTAIDATAARIHDAVARDIGKNSLVVLAGTEALESNQVGMMRTEMAPLSLRLAQASAMKCTEKNLEMVSLPAAIGAASALVDLLKSQTELTAISQSVPAALLAASVSQQIRQDGDPSDCSDCGWSRRRPSEAVPQANRRRRFRPTGARRSGSERAANGLPEGKTKTTYVGAWRLRCILCARNDRQRWCGADYRRRPAGSDFGSEHAGAARQSGSGRRHLAEAHQFAHRLRR